MGTGIAETVARAGHEVAVFEPIAEARAGSQQRITASTERALAAGKLDAAGQAGLQRVEAEDFETPVPHRELSAGIEAVGGHGDLLASGNTGSTGDYPVACRGVSLRCERP